MTETGEVFEVAGVDRPTDRFAIEPVPLYGRAAAGRRVVVATWSSWSYRLKDRPDVLAFPVGPTTVGMRPERFVLDLDDAEIAVRVA